VVVADNGYAGSIPVSRDSSGCKCGLCVVQACMCVLNYIRGVVCLVEGDEIPKH
jgi:hypothetical protein